MRGRGALEGSGKEGARGAGAGCDGAIKGGEGEEGGGSGEGSCEEGEEAAGAGSEGAVGGDDDGREEGGDSGGLEGLEGEDGGEVGGKGGKGVYACKGWVGGGGRGRCGVAFVGGNVRSIRFRVRSVMLRRVGSARSGYVCIEVARSLLVQRVVSS